MPRTPRALPLVRSGGGVLNLVLTYLRHLCIWRESVTEKILVVDDDEDLLLSYREIFNKKVKNSSLIDNSEEKSDDKFEVTTCSQGHEAIGVVQHSMMSGSPFKVAFIDMRMPPGIDGLETARLLRQRDSRIYIVIVTAYTDRSVDEIDAVLQKNVLLVTKPFNFQAIYQLARSLTKSWNRDHELEQSNSQLNLIFEHMNDGLVVTDAKGVIKCTNPKLEQLTGKTAEQLNDLDFTTLFEKEKEKEGFYQLQNSLQQSYDQDAQKLFQQLKNSNAPLLVIKIDNNSSVLDEVVIVNRACKKFFGYEPGKLKGHAMFEFLNEHETKLLEQRIYNHGNNKGSYKNQFYKWRTATGNVLESRVSIIPFSYKDGYYVVVRPLTDHSIRPELIKTSSLLRSCDDDLQIDQEIKHPDGTTIPVAISGASIVPEHGATKSSDMVFTVHDMSKVVEENKIKDELLKDLSRERSRLDYIIKGTNAGTWEWNIQTGEMIFNERWADIIGYTLEEISPTFLQTWHNFLHPEDLERSNVLLKRVFNKEIDYLEFEGRMKHKDGYWVWVLDRGAVSSWTEDGRPLSMSGTHQDITERKKMENRLKDAKQAAEVSNKAKDDFLATMSHELRTPLTSIIGNSELLAEQITDPKQQDMLSNVEAAGRNQLALVNDILDIFKIESNELEIHQQPYNLSKLLVDVEQMLSIYAKDANLELIIEQQNDEKNLLIGDSQRILQILNNLMGNAIKFTEEGTVKLTTSTFEKKKKYLIFTIEDTGVGMSVKALNNLFQRFEQVDGSISRGFGGSGLGLFISRRLAELMGGDINVSSVEGKGSVFKVILPYTSSMEVIKLQNNSKTKTTKDKSLKNDKFQGKALLVDDEIMNQKLIGRILENKGLNVVTANNGQVAVDLVAKQQFDLIFMDMQMPVMNGIEATKKIRDTDNPIPIVAFTANVMQEHRYAFYDAGCDYFLTKPIDKQMLSDILNKIFSTDK